MMQEQERKYAESLRRRYGEKSASENKMEKLRKLDAAVRRPAEIFAYSVGIIGALVLGVGMCLAMEVFADLMPLGIVIGIAGIAIVSVNYFLYRAILNSRRKKHAKEILSLSDELLND